MATLGYGVVIHHCSRNSAVFFPSQSSFSCCVGCDGCMALIGLRLLMRHGMLSSLLYLSN